jgi:hypothetical protein
MSLCRPSDLPDQIAMLTVDWREVRGEKDIDQIQRECISLVVQCDRHSSKY